MNSLAAGRRLAIRMLAWQTGVTLLLAALFLLRGLRPALAALFGGMVVIIPTGYFARRVLGHGMITDSRRTLGMFYRAELAKLFLMALGFWIGALWFGRHFAPLMLTCMACLAVNWLMLAVTRTH